LKTHFHTIRRALLKFGLVLGIAMSFSAPAKAVDGCTVLLCLANPAGPMAVSQCVPPIKQLFKDLAKLKPFPTCDMSGPGNFAQNLTTYYDRCPAGTADLAPNQYALQSAVPIPNFVQDENTVLALGIGDGNNIQPQQYDGGTYPLPPKVCVKDKVGEVIVKIGSGEDSQYKVAEVYKSVVILDPQSSPNAIDVFVNSEHFRRVRW
jgi:hypothetical protein